jgi:hypothetical protein
MTVLQVTPKGNTFDRRGTDYRADIGQSSPIILQCLDHASYIAYTLVNIVRHTSIDCGPVFDRTNTNNRPRSVSHQSALPWWLEDRTDTERCSTIHRPILGRCVSNVLQRHRWHLTTTYFFSKWPPLIRLTAPITIWLLMVSGRQPRHIYKPHHRIM